MDQNAGYPNYYTPKYLCLNLHDGQIKGLSHIFGVTSSKILSLRVTSLSYTCKTGDAELASPGDVIKRLELKKYKWGQNLMKIELLLFF